MAQEGVRSASRRRSGPKAGAGLRWLLGGSRISVVLLLGLARPAEAGDADIRLATRVPDGQGGVRADGWMFECLDPVGERCGGYAPRNDRFRALASQLGMVLAPRLASPARTPGHARFRVAAAWTGSFVAANEPYWQVTERAARTGEASDVLQTLQVEMRKGLPYSFELAGQLQWLVDSEVFAPGLELGWTLEEPASWAPDLAIRAAVSHAVGSRDFGLTTAAFAGIVSRSFGALGMVELTPWAAWAVVMPTARSRVIDPTPAGLVGTPLRRDVENDFVFEAVDLGDVVNHRASVGFRALVHVVTLGVQGELQVLGPTEPVYGVHASFGLDY